MREGGHSEVKPWCREEFPNRGMSLEYARQAWRCYVAAGSGENAILTFKEQDALTKPASPIAITTMANILVRAEHSPSSPAKPSD